MNAADVVTLMRQGRKVSIGMVHTLPLPGACRCATTLDETVARAVADATALERAGFDAVMVENLHDGPYADGSMDYQKVAALTKVCVRVRDAVGIPVGIDACGDPIAGFGIGSAAGLSFLRMPYFVDIRIGARGLCLPDAGNAVMARKRLNAEHIRILADIQVKHTYPLTEAIPLEESARWAVANLADALIVTGAETGVAASLDDLARVKRVSSVPVIAGSGVNSGNVRQQYAVCDGAIVGTALKRGGNTLEPIDGALAEAFVRASGS